MINVFLAKSGRFKIYPIASEPFDLCLMASIQHPPLKKDSVALNTSLIFDTIVTLVKTVVMAQLVEWSVRIPEVCSSNLVFGKICLLWTVETTKRGRECPIFESIREHSLGIRLVSGLTSSDKVVYYYHQHARHVSSILVESYPVKQWKPEIGTSTHKF